MPEEPLPPLRVREADGSPNVIPVFDMVFSGATLTKTGPTTVQVLVDSGAGGTGAPTDAPYVTYSANATLSAERILTAGSSVTLVTDLTAIYVNALTGGGATTVYAATGNQYVTISAAADLTDEYVFQASTGISLTSAGNILLVHYGSLLVTSTRAINTTAPLAGGGNFSADRTFTVDTLAVVSSGRSISTLFPVSGGGNLSADRTFAVDTAFLVTSARTITAGVGLTGGGNLSADRTVDLVTGGAGQYVITSVGAAEGIAWINTAAAGGGPVYAPTGGFYIAYAPDIDLTAERILIAGTNLQVASDTTNFFVSVSAKTIRIPLALLTIQPDSANAFWTARTGANVDFAEVRFLDAGEGIATWWGIVPFNVAPSPRWNLDLYSVAGTATAAGSAMYTVVSKAVATGEDLDSAAYTLIASAQVSSIFRSTTLTISAVSGGNFDAVVAVSNGDYLLVQLNRHGGQVVDSIGDFWDIKAVTMKVDVL